IHQSLKSHPNIVTLHRTLETSSFLLLVLEYVPGEDLLLSNSNPSQLLSCTRLRLIASMFSQMCDAVAACHDQQVFHRDIKPENFIVTDGWMSLSDGRQERKVIVKLSDFGLSSTDVESSDMDCGSAPYMSYGQWNRHFPSALF
ncbi:Protein kinase-like domain containing protein, partial [Amanita muscaria]